MTTLDPFDPLFEPRPGSEGDELRRLVRALELTKGFSLILCRAHPSQFPRLMASVEDALAGKRIQHCLCDTPRRSLLSLLAREISSPPPDAVFVSGMERWFRAEAAARSLEAVSARFLFSMNAHRNDFPSYVPCPLVLWLPEYVLLAIQRHAPDFFSIHSVLLRFPSPIDATPSALEQGRRAADGLEQSSMLSLSPEERDMRIEELKEALQELRSLPESRRDILLEASVLDRLATVLEGQGHFAEAEPFFVESLQLRRATLPEGDPAIAAALNNLGLLYRNLCRYDEAEPLYEEALRIDQATLPEGHPSIATSLNNLAYLYQSQGRYDEAEPLYMGALQMRRAALPEVHPDIATILNNLAYLYKGQDRYAEAEPLYKEALRIDQAALPEGHPNIASDFNNLAYLYDIQGRCAEAEPLYKEALQMRRAALPEVHPDIAISLNNLAGLYQSQGRYAEAEPLYRQALDMIQRSVGADHPTTRTIADNLMRITERQEQPTTSTQAD